ncbi:MAG: hypothetical protein AAGH19_07325 [Pseudomonadota bacterium]
MSFIAELKRRNVVRVGIAYVVTSWLLLQVVDVLGDLLGLPLEFGRTVVILLVIGFIPALIFAWAFQLTPEGLMRDRDLDPAQSVTPDTSRKLDRIIIALLGVVVAWFLLDEFYLERQAAGEPALAQAPGTAESSSAVAAGTEPRSLAVLPFKNTSPDPDNEYFADGISEELLNVLVDLDGLRVPSRTSSFAFREASTDIRAIAEALDVQHILEGSVRKAGNEVRITAQLIEVSSDSQLWSETYDRELEDIFAIQDEIAGHIVDALKLTLALEATRPPTEDLEAYTLYLQGRELLRQRDPDGLREADRLLQAATDRDPDFADAWAARSQVQIVLPGYVKDDIRKFEAPARRYAEQALAIDPQNQAAQLALAQISNVIGDEAEAIRRFEAFVIDHPNHSIARLWLAIGLVEAGYIDAAYEHITAALRADPVHATILDWYARIAGIAERPERLVETAERALQFGRPQGRVALHQYFLGEGSADDIAPYVEGEDDLLWGWFLRVYAVREDPALLPESMAWADEAEVAGAGFIAEYMRVNFLVAGGAPEDFFAQVRKIRQVDDTVNALVWMPIAKRHRQDPAMKDWVAAMNYRGLWEARGWPDLCRPLGEAGFECD